MAPPEENSPETVQLPGTPEESEGAGRGAAEAETPSGPRPEERTTSIPDVAAPSPASEAAPAARGTPVFAPGDLLAGRFAIVRFVAQGGMGEVYEAEDRELHEPVALKTVRPEIGEDPRAVERFKREIHLAHKVTHPNVCRIFDVFHDRVAAGPGGPEREIIFLTMEYLPGETLAARLRRERVLGTSEALAIVTQVATALDAAHAAGVVHRDFKSPNVLLVPGGAEGSALRAVVTDFGLAWAGREGSVAQSISTTGQIVGTPTYMAPEQVEGGPITPAVDIYALGVVMYEMMAGTPPFVGDSPIAAAVKRLKEPPNSPRTLRPDLDRAWEAAILRCLERDPANRFARAGDVVRALRGEEVPAARRVGRERWKWRAAAGVAVGLGLAAGAAYYLHVLRRPREAPAPPVAAPQAPVAPRRAVAVLGFKNLSRRPEAEWLSTALSEMMASELGAGEQLRTVPGENVARTKLELAIGDVDGLARDTLARLRARLGADYLVLGACTALGGTTGGRIRLDLRLQDAAAGETVASLTETGTEAELFDLVSRLGARLRAKLGVGELSEADSGSVRASLPSNPEAARLYSEGLARLRLFDALGARDLLDRAAKADARHALTHAALAEVWSLLGYDARAREEARKAFDLSTSLSREDRLAIEARYRETTQEWDKAVDIYRSLFRFFPDDLEYGLRLASAEESAGKGKEALTTLEALRRLPPPARDDPRIDLTEAVTARFLGESKRAAAAAGRTATKATAQAAVHLLARARFEEGSALQNLGELDKAKGVLEEAERMFAKAGDRRGRAAALNNAALVLLERGDLDGAKRVFEEALALYREIGNRSGVALMLSNLGNVHYYKGELSQARSLWERTLATYREINEKHGIARMLTNIASAVARQGDLAGARVSFEEALAAWREIGGKSGAAVVLGNLGILLHQQGDLAGATERYREALAIGREIGDKTYLTATLSGYGDLLVAKGDLTGARKHYEEALGIREALGQKGEAAASRLALAGLDLEEGRVVQAEASARTAAQDAELVKVSDSAGSAQALLARTLLSLRRVQEAGQAARQATELLAKSEDRGLRLSAGIIAARVQAASGDGGQKQAAMRRLQTVLEEATRVGLVGQQLEARLTLGETEIAAGHLEAARARLEALEREATAKGFGLIAAKARGVLAGTTGA